MLVKLEALLVGAIATFEAASASSVARRQFLNELPTVSQDIQNRLQGQARIGDVCYPIGTYTLGGSELVPPCVAEQAISLKCEALTAPGRTGTNGTSPEQWNAYKNCLSGQEATYFQDVKGCLACKQTHGYLSSQQAEFFTDRYNEAEADFANATDPSQTVWGLVTARIGRYSCVNKTSNAPMNDWSCYNQLDQPSGIATKNQTAKAYYKNAPKSQNIGQFTLNGKQYPEITVGERLSTVLVPVYEVVSEISYVYDVRVSGGNYNIGTKFEAHTQVKISQEFSQIKCLYNFTKADTFTIVSTISAPVPVADSTRVVPAEEAVAIKLPACNNCSTVSLSLDESRAMATSIKPAPKGVVEIAKPLMEGLEKNDLSKVKEGSVALSVKIEADFTADLKQVIVQSSPSEAGSSPSSECSPVDQKAKDASPSTHLQAGSSKSSALKITICLVDDPNDCREAVI